MRQLKPLNLPRMIAERDAASRSSEDVTLAATTICSHTSGGSVSSASDASTPSTPTFSLRGHSRFPSSSSSLTSTSTSPICEHGEISGSASKLPMPKLPEEPAETDDSLCERKDSFGDAFDSYQFGEECSDRTTILLRDSCFYDLDAMDVAFYQASPPVRGLRHQRSMDTFNNLSMRLNSFTRRFTRKNTSVPAGLGIQTSNLSQPASSRSSSLTSSHFPGFEHGEFITPPTPALSSKANSMPSSPIDQVERLSIVESIVEADEEPIDRKTLSSTPLLPPMMNATVEDVVEPVQSPLQSPTIADPEKTLSIVSLSETSQVLAFSSPPLSTKPSIASFHRGRASTFASTTEPPPLHVEEVIDEWSIKLGHANFTIDPEPYLPAVSDVETYDQLQKDWHTARDNYFKHRAKTAEHFGNNSKQYHLTEAKWHTIDAAWKRNAEVVATEASLHSGGSSPVVPAEPAPLTNMPTLTDPRCDGKFPTLGDQDIVGPMEVGPPLPQTQPPCPTGKLTTFLRHMFGRSRSATR